MKSIEEERCRTNGEGFNCWSASGVFRIPHGYNQNEDVFKCRDTIKLFCLYIMIYCNNDAANCS